MTPVLPANSALPVAAGVSAWATFAPVLWFVGDRTAARARFDGGLIAPVRTSPGDVPGFLESVARAVRAGESSAQALLRGVPCSRAVERMQSDLRAGASVRDALDRGSPVMAMLRSCMHHGVLSASALEHAALAERSAVRAEAEALAAVASTRHSVRILTSLPFVILVFAAAVSGAVRSALLSPAALVAVLLGAVANRVGSVWISRIASDCTDPRLRTAERACVTVAANVRAGGSVESAVEAASSVHPAFVEASRRLVNGAPLVGALEPLDDVCPPLRTVLVDAQRDGRPVCEAVTALAEQVRAENSAVTRARIARIPVRATVPLVTCVLPSFVLLSVVPVALAALGGLA